MLNVLVVDDNIFFAKTLINSVLQSNQELRLCMIATDGKEALDIINKNKIDIILLDLNLPTYTGLEILENLIKNKKETFYKSIIVISGETDMILKVRDNPLIYSYIIKGSDMKNIIKLINELSNIKRNELSRANQIKKFEKIIKKKILDELGLIGYNVKYSGTRYLADTIFLLYFLKSQNKVKLEKDIYPILAKRYKKTVNTIKCDIISATSKVNCDIEKTQLKEYFGYFFDRKVSPKLVANTVLNKLD